MARTVAARTREATKLAIVTLLGNPALTHEQIALMSGKSRRSVSRIAKELKLKAPNAVESLEEYRRAIAAKLPIQARVDTYHSIIKQKKDQKSRLGAVIRVDQLLGHHTEVELRTRDAQPQVTQRIVFPPGTSVKLTRVTETMEVSQPAAIPAAINIPTEQP